MIRWQTGALLMCLGAMLLESQPASPQDRGGMQASGSINWLTDKRKAWDEARRTGKPIFALFR